jgi:hypothetical protein
VELGHKVLWEYCAQLKHSMSYDVLGTTNQAAMRQAAEDQYLAYILLVNSNGQHEHLRKELQNNFTKGSNKYPENCSQTLLFLHRYSKSAPVDSALHGTAFAQKGGWPKKGKEKKGSNKPKAIRKDFDKEYFKDLPCFKCGKKGHPQPHCPTKTNVMTMICPSPASWIGAISQAGSRRSRILRINSRTWRSPSCNWSRPKRAIRAATPVKKCCIFSMVPESMGEGASQKRWWIWLSSSPWRGFEDLT